MKLLVFSDIHGDTAALKRLLETEADYYIAAGDMVSWARGLDRVGEILARRGPRVWALPGNHESEVLIAAMCSRFGLNYFHGRSFQAAGFHVAGLGYSNPTPFNTPGEYTEAEIAERLKPFAALSPLVLICHCPPKGTLLDRVREGVHAGSQSIRDFLDRHAPAHFVSGHIHEAEGVTVRIGRTLAASAGRRGYLLALPDSGAPGPSAA